MSGLKFALVAGLGAAALGAGGVQAAIVLSDNFNADATGLNWPGDAVFTSTSAPGSVDLIGPGFFNLCGSGNGNCVDLDGSSGSGNNPAGQLTSNATFGPGTYTLTFLLGGNGRGAPAQTTTVSLGSFSTVIAPTSNDPLTSRSFTFTTTTSGALVFTENGPSDQQGNLLDNVSLSSVPEPATWAMMLVGFAATGFGLRRRTRAVAA